MQCRDISDGAFEAIRTELTSVQRAGNAIETVSGMHEEFGMTVLLRDGSRCMALVEDPTGLDRVLARMAFAADAPVASQCLRSTRQ